jgi:hypothetical protein
MPACKPTKHASALVAEQEKHDLFMETRREETDSIWIYLANADDDIDDDDERDAWWTDIEIDINNLIDTTHWTQHEGYHECSGMLKGTNVSIHFRSNIPDYKYGLEIHKKIEFIPPTI